MIIGQYEFEGPFTKASDLREQAGVYVVLCALPNDVYEVLAVDYCNKNVRNKLLQNADHDLWIQLCQGKLQVTAFYADEGTESLEKIKIAIQLEMCTSHGSSPNQSITT